MPELQFIQLISNIVLCHPYKDHKATFTMMTPGALELAVYKSHDRTGGTSDVAHTMSAPDSEIP